MKKILLSLILTTLFGVTSIYSQLYQIEKEPKSETILKLRGNTVRLTKTGSKYFIVLPTSNRFDDPFIIMLGDGEESISTIDQMINWVDSLQNNESVTAMNVGRKLSINKRSGMGTSVLYLQMDGYAGIAGITKKELVKIREKLTVFAAENAVKQVPQQEADSLTNYKEYDINRAVSIAKDKGISLVGYTKDTGVRVYYDYIDNTYLIEEHFVRRYGEDCLQKLISASEAISQTE